MSRDKAKTKMFRQARFITSVAGSEKKTQMQKDPGLPDFYRSKHTKMGKMYQVTTNYTKLP
jgi:hypothetical protein